MPSKKMPEITLEVTEDHFRRGIPGDQCHCTIGEAVHDQLGPIMSALDLTIAEPGSIRVNPAEADGDPCVGVSLVGVNAESEEVHVRFLLQEAAAFKVAYTTDNRATGAMKRAASRRPYVLHASQVRTRKSRTGKVTDGGRAKFTPEGHIKALSTYSARKGGDAAEVLARVTEKLEAKKADKSLPYKLTPALKRFAAQAAEASVANRGTNTPRLPSVKVHRNKRFHA